MRYLASLVFLFALIFAYSGTAAADLGALPEREDTESRELAGQKNQQEAVKRKEEDKEEKKRAKERREHLKYLMEIDRSRQ